MRLHAGQWLYRAGQRGEAVFALRSGLVKETIALKRAPGGERIVRMVAASGVTGLPALAGEPHRHGAAVLSDGLACRIPVSRLRRLIEEDAARAQVVWAQWQGALDDVDELLMRFAVGPAQARLASWVLYLFEREGPHARLRRRDAASLIGIAPVSITRLLTRFKQQGLIEEVGGRLIQCDRPRLLALVQDNAGAPIRRDAQAPRSDPAPH